MGDRARGREGEGEEKIFPLQTTNPGSLSFYSLLLPVATDGNTRLRSARVVRKMVVRRCRPEIDESQIKEKRGQDKIWSGRRRADIVGHRPPKATSNEMLLYCIFSVAKKSEGTKTEF